MICSKKDCTGCFACINSCPKNCIEMKEDEHGYIYPEIDKSKCINCNMCVNVCPSNNKVKGLEPKKCYAMYSKDKNTRNTSTSGGAATIFSKTILENGGIVYGVSFTKDNFVRHIRVENREDLKLLQGSKYVHSYIFDTFSKAKEDLRTR